MKTYARYRNLFAKPRFRAWVWRGFALGMALGSAALALSGCAAWYVQEAADECALVGIKPGMDAYDPCVRVVAKRHASEVANAFAAGFAATYRPPVTTTCHGGNGFASCTTQ